MKRALYCFRSTIIVFALLALVRGVAFGKWMSSFSRAKKPTMACPDVKRSQGPRCVISLFDSPAGEWRLIKAPDFNGIGDGSQQ